MMVICRFPASNHRSPRVGKPTPGGAGMSGPSTCLTCKTLTCGDLFLKHHHVSDSVKSCCQLELGRRVQINARLESRGGVGGGPGGVILCWNGLSPMVTTLAWLLAATLITPCICYQPCKRIAVGKHSAFHWLAATECLRKILENAANIRTRNSKRKHFPRCLLFSRQTWRLFETCRFKT